jgi:L-2-hydroxyglutarate oxidase LhgO
MIKDKYEFIIIGGGMVGLCLANQIIRRKISKSICIIDKEEKLGMHSSGRNSGVLHAGIYYEPNSLKAKVCIKGSKRLKSWIKERELPINNCGKIIIPQSKDVDSELDKLFYRGIKNGAKVEMINNKKLNSISKHIYSSTGRAIWSPNTSVVNPKIILSRLEDELKREGVKFLKGQKNLLFNIESNEIVTTCKQTINYIHLINSAGLEADNIAKKFNIGNEFFIIPFKGIYWELKKSSQIKLSTNVYPVPDLNVPFLGVHFTPNYNGESVSIGPTATFAFGKENYGLFDNIEIFKSIRNLQKISSLYLSNKGGFRKYIHEQSLQNLSFIMINSAKKIIPEIKLKDIKLSKKVGIRAQLFNKNRDRFEDDFICLKGLNSTHILNSISPAFTSSFELADFIIENSTFK